MDLRVKHLSQLAMFPRSEDGLRAMVQRAPRATALAMAWIECSRPAWMKVCRLRRRIGTVAVAVLTCILFVHVMFGANGMVVYKQKRAEREALQEQIIQARGENERYTEQIQALKSDQKAVEKEAREQLGYAKPGEYVYVPPTPAPSVPSANHSAKR
jgi:cell division protein FtsB